MASNDRNLGNREVFVPLEGGLWSCPQCGATNPSVKRICEGCGQLVRFRRLPSGILAGVFFALSALAFFAVCEVRGQGAAAWGGIREVLGGFNWIALVLLAIGLYFLWKRPTGKQFARDLRERGF
jgi:hypothetical protein